MAKPSESRPEWVRALDKEQKKAHARIKRDNPRILDRKFEVVAAYVGECCTQAHLYSGTVVAANKDQAEAKVRVRLARQHLDVGDVTARPAK
jgi:hypothetical protein